MTSTVEALTRRLERAKKRNAELERENKELKEEIRQLKWVDDLYEDKSDRNYECGCPDGAEEKCVNIMCPRK